MVKKQSTYATYSGFVVVHTFHVQFRVQYPLVSLLQKRKLEMLMSQCPENKQEQHIENKNRTSIQPSIQPSIANKHWKQVLKPFEGWTYFVQQRFQLFLVVHVFFQFLHLMGSTREKPREVSVLDCSKYLSGRLRKWNVLFGFFSKSIYRSKTSYMHRTSSVDGGFQFLFVVLLERQLNA